MTTSIPNRSAFRAQEVCEIAQVQLYVLRSWEAEFSDLGLTKSAGGPRVYRRADVERVLRLKELVFVEGLTLAGARNQIGRERGAPEPQADISDADVAAMLDHETHAGLRDVRRGLKWILGVLSGDGVTPEDLVLAATSRRAARAGASSKPARPAKSPKSVKAVKAVKRTTRKSTPEARRGAARASAKRKKPARKR